MIYAIYRCLYGEDFIQQSINSIDKFVDKIFVFWDDTPWGDVSECIYKGKVIKFPKKFDNILDRIKELKNPKIQLIYDHVFDNISQFTHFVNDIILPNYERPKRILIVEVDHIFREDQLQNFFENFDKSEQVCATSKQIELWKYSNYRIDERYRIGSILWNMEKINKMPYTRRQADLE